MHTICIFTEWLCLCCLKQRYNHLIISTALVLKTIGLGKVLFLSGTVLSYILRLQVEGKENVDTDDISKVSEKGSVY